VSAVHHGDPVAHREGLVLVVGDVDRCQPELALDRDQLGSNADSQLGIQVREGLVQQQHLGIHDQGSCQGDTLLLPAAELAGEALLETGETQELQGVRHALGCALAADTCQAQSVADVFGNAHVGEQGVILKDHRRFASMHGDVVHAAVADEDVAGVGLVKPSQHAQGGGFAAAGRA
jgi:hypothetical protein